MAEMNFAAVMTAVAAVPVDVGLIDRSYDWPTADINPPCLVVSYPEGPNDFDATMRRGHDRATFPAYLVVGDLVKRVTRDKLQAYLEPFKSAIESAAGHGDPEDPTPVPWSSVRVASWSVVPFAVEGLDYAAIKFEIDVLT